jgi:hypothetical protein
MKYQFQDLWNEEIYEKSNVLFVTGQYGIFNSIAVDKAKAYCRAKSQLKLDEAMLKEFGLETTEEDVSEGNLNRLEFVQYLSESFTPSVLGRWYCFVLYKALTDKQKKALDEFIKEPSTYGTLVVQVEDYKEYAKYLRNKAFSYREHVNLIQLSFPKKESLVRLVTVMFKVYDIDISEDAAELFVFKMSDVYEEYSQMVLRIATDVGSMKIDRANLAALMKDTNKFVLDDFIYAMLEVKGGADSKGKRRKRRNDIHKMAQNIIYDLGPRTFVNQLKRKAREYLTYRMEINRGNIPIQIPYSINEVKVKLGEEHPLYKISEYRFRKLASVAAKTSIEDWVYIWLILSRVGNMGSDEMCERAIYSIIHRTAFSHSRLMNNINAEDVLTEEMYQLNHTLYTEDSIEENLDNSK